MAASAAGSGGERSTAMRAKWLLTSLLAIASLARFVPAQPAERDPKPMRPQAEEGSLPGKPFRSKDASAKAHREAFDVYNVNKLEQYIKQAKYGDSYRDGETIFITKDDLLLALRERNRKKIQAFKDSLPRDGEYYVVEGDLLLTDEEIAGHLSLTSRIKEFRFLQEGDPMVNIHDGEDDYYKTPESRLLTYFVDRQSFGARQYQQVAADLARATREWQEACPGCGVAFTQTEAGDARPSREGANFVVRPHDAKGVYVASAFFPHDPPERRYLNIDPHYFSLSSQAERVGVLRHQLGHILGYRHVQPRGIAGCYYKDGKFLPLSMYAGNSVMEYFCSGDSTLARELTGADTAFHRRTYEPPKMSTSGGQVSSTPAILITRYEGGDVAGNVAGLLRELVRLNLVRVASHTVAGGSETVKSIYQSRLRLPVYSQALAELANELNKGRLKEGPLETGTEVLYPEVEFNHYEQTLKLDSDSEEDRAFEKELRAHDLIVRKSGKEPLALVTVKAYELRLAVGSVEQLRGATDTLRTFISQRAISNVLVSSRELPRSPSERPTRPLPGETPPQYFNASAAQAVLGPPVRQVTASGVQDVLGFFSAAGLQGVDVGTEGGIRFLTDMPTVPPSLDGYRCSPQVNCPEVILVDTEVYPHPDLKDDLKNGYRKSYPTEDRVSVTPTFSKKFAQKKDGRQNIRLSPDEVEEDEHGTHMAGIIASRANEYGVVGLAPNVTLDSVNWQVFKSNRDSLQKLLEARDRNGRAEGRQQIVVFATSWPVNGGRLDREEDRWVDTLADRIRNSTHILVVAAIGQPHAKEEDKRPKEIDQRFPNGPMNLGDLDNVITVTACEYCYDASPRVIAMANIPAKNAGNMVHVAAPGWGIPSTVKPKGEDDVRYAKANGTSPATAIVAGVVAEMIGYWPNSYQHPSSVKRRIQVTSRPTLFSEGQGGKHLSVGIVDPAVALRNPTTNWLRDTDGGWYDIGDFRWIESEIPVVHPRTGNKSRVSTVDLLRIYRLEEKGQTYWVFYTQAESKGSINRLGPFIVDPVFQKKNLITLGSQESDPESRGTKYKLEKIQDLLLKDVNDAVLSNTPQ